MVLRAHQWLGVLDWQHWKTRSRGWRARWVCFSSVLTVSGETYVGFLGEGLVVGGEGAAAVDGGGGSAPTSGRPM